MMIDHQEVAKDIILEPTQTALYFPYIQVPRTPWFTQVLLYWDKAATIVPRQALAQEVDPYMRGLWDVGILDYLDPYEALHFKGIEFEQGFLGLLDIAEPPPPENLRIYTGLHVDKLGMTVFQDLRDRGLTQPGPARYGDWYRVESTTAGLYMSYLASAISGARPGTRPVTDQIDPLYALAKPNNVPGITRLDALRLSFISDALPAPSGAVEPQQLAEFKQRYGDELLRCRTHLDGELAILASIEDAELREVRGARVLREIRDDIAILTEQMTRRRWPGVALTSFCGVGTTAAGSATALFSDGSPLLQGIGIGAAVLGGIPVAREVIRSIKTEKYDRRAPLAYAALAARQFGQQ